ncbi:MAG: AI-2E family transporter [Chloroflexia bacterium]
MGDRIYLSSRARATIIWITVAVTLVFLWQVHEILTPFIWAIVTAYVLNPVVVFLARKTGMPRRIWAILFYALLLALLLWGLGTLLPLLSQQFALFLRDLPGHVREAGKFGRELGLLDKSVGNNVIDILGTQINLNASDAEISKQLSALVSQQLGRSAIPALARGFEGVLRLLVYLVSTFFLLLEMDRIGDGIARLTPHAGREELGPWVRRINHVLGAYIRGQFFLVVLMSVTSYTALSILDVRYAPLLAIFTGLVETMPFIGPYIAGGAAVLVALTQGTAPFGWSPMALALAVALTYTILRQLEDNLVMPFLIGRLVHLHPLVIIFSVLSGAALAGILGLLLAVPMAATLKIVATYLYGKLSEAPPRTVATIDDENDWDDVASRIRQAALVSKMSGASPPSLLVSVPVPPAILLDPVQFHRLKALFEESQADAVLLTSDPPLVKLAQEAGIATEREPAWSGVRAPEPDYEESEPNTLLRRMRRDKDERGEPLARPRLFQTRPLSVAKQTGPLSTPKELDEERPV